MFYRYGPWVLWCAVLWGAAKLHELPWPTNHSVCGIWGCGPPVQALVSCHLIWFVILAPVAFLGYYWLPSRIQKAAGWSLVGASLLSISGIGVYEWYTWATNNELAREYLFRRWWFVVITMTDIPILQVALLGISWVLPKTICLAVLGCHSTLLSSTTEQVPTDQDAIGACALSSHSNLHAAQHPLDQRGV